MSGKRHRPRVLMLAPQPVLQARGTPISVFERLRALSELGYEIDLLTYPLGDDFALDGVRIERIRRPWGLRRIEIGPSFAKIVLDVLMAARAWALLHRHSYVIVHSHEEAAIFGTLLARARGVAHIYDMHSILPQQFDNWKKWYAAPAQLLFRRGERVALRRNSAVITVCSAVDAHAARIAPALSANEGETVWWR